MTDVQALQIALNLHTRTMIGLLDAIERTEPGAARSNLIVHARDEVLEFKREVAAAFFPTPATVS